MDDLERTRLSRLLSGWLRHRPGCAGLTLSKEGWAPIERVLAAYVELGHDIARADLDNIVRLDPKSRYEVEGDRIRARYGHSVQLEQAHHPGVPPAVLYHGTARRFLERILQAGLQPMKRQYVHLSPDRKTAREVGARRDQEPVILRVAAHEAHRAGVRFYPRGQGVWLSDPVPAQFLSAEPAPGEGSEGGGRANPAPGTPRRRRPQGGFMKR